MNRLKDKVAIITGADGGICSKASEFFCQEGAKVVMVDKDPNVHEKCAAIVANGGDAIAITADMSKRENWEMVLKEALAKYGKVDCVVIDQAPAQSFVEQNPGLTILDTEYAVEDYAIGVAKGNTSLLNAINTVLEELQADGTIQSIIDKYIPAE